MRMRGPAFLVIALLAASPAVGSPLSKAECGALKTQYDALVADGAKSDMDHGAAWAHANLTPDRLGKVKQLISLEEQLSFRCDLLVTARPAMLEHKKPTAVKDDNAAAKPAKTSSDADPTKPSNIEPPVKKPDVPKASSAYVPPPPSMAFSPSGYKHSNKSEASNEFNFDLFSN